MFFTKMFVAIVMTEAFAEIISSGAIFQALRERMWGPDQKKGRFAGLLLSCGYCLSFWFGILFAYALNIHGELIWLKMAEPLVWGVVAHRAANLIHGLWTTLKKFREAFWWRVVEAHGRTDKKEDA